MPTQTSTCTVKHQLALSSTQTSTCIVRLFLNAASSSLPSHPPCLLLLLLLLPARIALCFVAIFVLWDIKSVFYLIWKPFDWLVGYTDPRKGEQDRLHGKGEGGRGARGRLAHAHMHTRTSTPCFAQKGGF